MSKELEKLKLPSRITSFPDVERMIKSLEARFHKIESSIKKPAEKDVKETEGETGDTKISRNVDGTYTFELKTKEGWKVPTYGGTAVNFDNKPPLVKAKIKKDLDTIVAEDAEKGQNIAQKTIYDEKNEKFDVSHLTGVPRPDYDSKWINYDHSAHEIGGSLPAWRHTHTLGQLPMLIKIYFAPNQENGTMGSGDTLTEPQSNVTWFTEINNHLGHSYANPAYYGLVYKVDAEYVYLVGGNARSGIFSNFSMSNANSLETYDGAIRILMLK